MVERIVNDGDLERIEEILELMKNGQLRQTLAQEGYELVLKMREVAQQIIDETQEKPID